MESGCNPWPPFVRKALVIKGAGRTLPETRAITSDSGNVPENAPGAFSQLTSTGGRMTGVAFASAACGRYSERYASAAVEIRRANARCANFGHRKRIFSATKMALNGQSLRQNLRFCHLPLHTGGRTLVQSPTATPVRRVVLSCVLWNDMLYCC